MSEPLAPDFIVIQTCPFSRLGFFHNCFAVTSFTLIKKVEDVVLINKELMGVLKDYLQALKLFRPDTTNDDYLFPGRSGKKSPLIKIEKAVKKILSFAGLPDYYSVHSLRHTHGFHVYNEKKNLKLVQVRLRHASIQTAGIYTGVSAEEERETINNLYE